MNSHILFLSAGGRGLSGGLEGNPRRSATRRRARRWRDAGQERRGPSSLSGDDDTHAVSWVWPEKVKGGCFHVSPVWAVYLAHLTHAERMDFFYI
jgi:hypothetical protein